MRDNIANRIDRELPQPVTRLIRRAGRAASGFGHTPYLVGGIVRDLLLGRQSKDIDIMVEGNALELADTLSKTLTSKPTVHKRFGTATFRLDDYRIDLASCRSETYDHPGSLPRVKPGDIKDDLHRRDFTVNAMAVCIDPKRFGELIDLYGGRKDLEDQLIRILHDESFADDATRIMRAVRYEQRLGFKLEKRTARLLRQDLRMLDTIGADRLRHEVILWLSEQQPGKIVRRAARLGVLQKLHPSLSWGPRIAKAFRGAAGLYGDLPPVSLYLALLTYSLDHEQLGELLRRLNIEGGVLYEATTQTLSLKDRQGLFAGTALPPSKIYFKLRDFDTTAVAANALCAASRDVRIKLKLYMDKLRFVKTRLNGKDLAAMGVPRGRTIGVILEKLLAARLDGKVKTRTEEEQLALQLLRDL